MKISSRIRVVGFLEFLEEELEERLFVWGEGIIIGGGTREFRQSRIGTHANKTHMFLSIYPSYRCNSRLFRRHKILLLVFDFR